MPEWEEAGKRARHPPVSLSLLDEIEIDELVKVEGCPRCHGLLVKVKAGVYQCMKCKCGCCGSFVMWDFWLR